MSVRFVLVASISLVCVSAHAQTPEPWIGRWSLDPAGCTGFSSTANTAPLIASERTVSWHLDTCRIGKLYKTGQDAHIQGHCFNDGVAKDMPISLKPHGNKMQVIWDNKPVGEMQKCK
jgi:hypothetical protein